jgi:hypothetical protein
VSLSVSTARARVFAVLAGVAGISGGAAMVHDYFRLIQDEETLKSLAIGTSGRVHVWMLSLSDQDPFVSLNAQGQPGRAGLNFDQVRYAFQIFGWYGVQDAAASEKAWASQVEAVITAFRNAVLTGTAKLGEENVIEAGPSQWVEGGYRMLPGNVLCHFARLTISVRALP